MGDDDPAGVARGERGEVAQPVVGQQVGVVDDERGARVERLAGLGGVAADGDARGGPGGGQRGEDRGLAVPARTDDVDAAGRDRVGGDVAQGDLGTVGERRRVQCPPPPPLVPAGRRRA
ncbi:hypothetical protein [Pseudonocardia broussonetiae]|uniref:Uncharacterized protein n=1 Tax=Pseudonocardia broussonetiae TaxID=2736640 RepID=A0A6M6JDC9_9PSEU|nr:hypothetical protein [Pseudonocardia broussonetiae]QJY45958.1 hypothetical protein HOP40_09210 [Pseudonocardia broussonetiae]